MFRDSAIWGDIRYAVRIMYRTPLFTANVVLTVAIAIAANATIFTVVNAVMIRSLPFAEPNRIMQVAEKNDKTQPAHLRGLRAELSLLARADAIVRTTRRSRIRHLHSEWKWGT